MPGKRIQDLDPYGSYDSDKMQADIFEVSKNSGTSGSPVYAADGSRRITLAQLGTMLKVGYDDEYLKLSGGTMTGDIAMSGGAQLRGFENPDNYLQFNDTDVVFQYKRTNGGVPLGYITAGQYFDDLGWQIAYNDGYKASYIQVRTEGFYFSNQSARALTKTDKLTSLKTFYWPNQNGDYVVSDTGVIKDIDNNDPVLDIENRRLYYKDTSNVAIDFYSEGSGLALSSSPGVAIASASGMYAFLKTSLLSVNTNYEMPATAGTLALAATTLAGYGITDAYTKTQVDGFITGIDWKTHVAAAASSNITLSGTQSIDGYAAQIGDRILVFGQTTATQNGLYIVASGAWTRTTDADTGAELISATVYVEQGTLNGGKQFTNSNTGTIVIGVTNVTFAQIAGAGTYSAGTGLQLIGNQFSIDSTVVTLTGSQALSNKTGLISQWTNDSGYLLSTLANSKIFVGNGSNVATAQTLTLSATPGSFALDNAGILTMPNADTATRGLLLAADWNTFNNKFTLPALTSGSVIFSNGTTLIQDNANFYYNSVSHLLSVSTSGDQSGTDSINIYKMIDTYTPNASDNGLSISHSRGTGASPSESLASDYIGPVAWYAYNASTYPEVASIRGYVEGATSTNRGARIEFWTKPNGAALASAGLIDSNQLWTVGSGTAVGKLNNYYTKTGIATFTITGGATTSTSNSITYTSNTIIKVGDAVTGTGIPANTYVYKIVSNTNALLTKSATASNTGLTFTIRPGDFGYYSSMTYTDGAGTGNSAFGGYINYTHNSTAVVGRGLVIATSGGGNGFATTVVPPLELITDAGGAALFMTSANATINPSWQMGVGAANGLSAGVFGIGITGSTPIWTLTQSSGASTSMTMTMSGTAANAIAVNTGVIALQLRAVGGGATNINYTSIDVSHQGSSGGGISTTGSGTVNILGVGLVGSSSIVSPSAGSLEFNHIKLGYTYNTSGGTGHVFRGIYYAPTATSVTGVTEYVIESTRGNARFGGTTTVVDVNDLTVLDADGSTRRNALTSLNNGFLDIADATGAFAHVRLLGGKWDFDNATNAIFTVASNGIMFTNGTSGQTFNLRSNRTQTTGYTWAYDAANTNTSGTFALTSFAPNYAPTSGNPTFNIINFASIYNLTGTSGAIVTAINYAPTLTSLTGTTHYFLQTTSGLVKLGDTTDGATGAPTVASIATAGGLAVAKRYWGADDVIVNANTKGIVLKSANGHYWRFTVDNTGAMSAGSDLGTSI